MLGSLATTIRAAFVKDGGMGVELRKVLKPTLEEGSILVKLKASGICGTDLEKTIGRNITSSVLGHEVSGVVSESASARVESGEIVVPHHHVSCGKCYLCASGAETMCDEFKRSNFVPCGLADEFLVPRHNVEGGGVHLVPERISFEEASMAEPLGCCIRGIERIFRTSNEKYVRALRNVLVVGAGPIGLLHMELLRSRFQNLQNVEELNIVAVDVSEARLKFAEKFEGSRGVNPKRTQGEFAQAALKETHSNSDGGFDLAIIATGNPQVVGETLRCLRKSGRMLIFGAPYKGSVLSLDLADFFLNEFTITSSYSASEREIETALEMMKTQKIDVRKFITARFPLQQVSEAFEAARSENHIKVLVTE